MPSLNSVQLIGRLTRDPELRWTPSGAAVTHFVVATNHWTRGPDGERKEVPEFHACVAWSSATSKLAERLAEHTHKGSLVYVEGRLQTRSYEHHDEKRKVTEVVAHNVQFLDSKRHATEELPA